PLCVLLGLLVLDGADLGTVQIAVLVEVEGGDDILEDSRLTDLVLKANNLDPKDYEKAKLKKIFKSDPDDKKSYLNT
ncbi:hypothetical protein ACC695_41015, partial [Rhizobium ruizarguesonis]